MTQHSEHGLGPVAALETQLVVGSHIVTQRRTYRHHGIYVGAGKVVHYAGFAHGLHRGPVQEVTLDEFASGQAVRVLACAAAFDPCEIVRRARSRLGENSYRVVTNNCEHFCEWCVRGESRSYQIEALLSWPVRVLRVALQGARMRVHLSHNGERCAPQLH